MSQILSDFIQSHYGFIAIAFVLFWAAFIVQSAFGLSSHKARTYDQRKY